MNPDSQNNETQTTGNPETLASTAAIISSSETLPKENPSVPLAEGLLTQERRINVRRRRRFDRILDRSNLHLLEDKGYLLYMLSLIVQNTKPVGHPDIVGMAISVLLLADCSLVMLTLLQLYSFSLADVFLILFILPLGILLSFHIGINTLFSHGPRRSACLARVYYMWNVTSIVNVLSCSLWLLITVQLSCSNFVAFCFPLGGSDLLQIS